MRLPWEAGEMGAATALAPSSGALEAHVAAQFAPVRGIEWSQLRSDWHGYAAPSSRAHDDKGITRPHKIEQDL